MRKTPCITDFQKAADSVKPFSMDTTVYVDFDLSDSLFEDAVEEEVMVISASANPAAKLDLDDMKKFMAIYLAILLGLRIDWVLGNRVPIKPDEPQFTVPVFFTVILCQIGRVLANADRGYTLLPSNKEADYWTRVTKEYALGCDVTTEDGRRQWLRAASMKMRQWYNVSHIEYADAMIKSKDGSLDLMMMHVVENEMVARAPQDATHEELRALRAQNEVRSDRGDRHPIFALAAAVVGVHQRFVCALQASNYGTFSMLRGSLSKVADLESGYGRNN